ncbi:hypothetical protein BC628DRAFT_706502 [Trametes gibbosa]|nr:hypothetical protein BC628DRAFT_706502 [Trametes gibbosa]
MVGFDTPLISEGHEARKPLAKPRRMNGRASLHIRILITRAMPQGTLSRSDKMVPTTQTASTPARRSIALSLFRTRETYDAPLGKMSGQRPLQHHRRRAPARSTDSLPHNTVTPAARRLLRTSAHRVRASRSRRTRLSMRTTTVCVICSGSACTLTRRTGRCLPRTSQSWAWSWMVSIGWMGRSLWSRGWLRRDGQMWHYSIDSIPSPHGIGVMPSEPSSPSVGRVLCLGSVY